MHTYQNKWLLALKCVLPIYLTVHALFAVLTLFSSLFTIDDFSSKSLPLSTLWKAWDRWDTGHYKDIATRGYDKVWRTAFFPLYPLVERAVTFLIHHLFTAGLVVSNVAGLIALVVLYQVVKEDFDEECAGKSVLYLSIFPSAFFLADAYTESLFLCLVLLSFYQIRRHNFWLAGIFGFFACLARSAGIFLLFPLTYELLRRRQLRFDLLSVALIPAALVGYSVYCFTRFGDFLAWEHAQNTWHHQFHLSSETLFMTLQAMRHSLGLLCFQTLHNALDFVSVLFVLCVVAFMVIGPYRLRREHLAYVMYAVPLVLFFLSAPVIGDPPIPLQSVPRYMLEVFPVFIVAGHMGKHRWFHEGYVLISGGLLCISCLLFLVGHWMV